MQRRIRGSVLAGLITLGLALVTAVPDSRGVADHLVEAVERQGRDLLVETTSPDGRWLARSYDSGTAMVVLVEDRSLPQLPPQEVYRDYYGSLRWRGDAVLVIERDGAEAAAVDLGGGRLPVGLPFGLVLRPITIAVLVVGGCAVLVLLRMRRPRAGRE